MDQREVIEYYDATAPLYRYLWYQGSESHALHYGLWEEGTRSLREALLNTNRLLAGLAGIKPGTSVLDAGTGIGGSAIWLARHVQARVTGITLSEKQVQTARALARKYLVGHLARFAVQDYTHTAFQGCSFDVVWAIESVCHAARTRDVLEETWRLLKPGGRIVVADGFLKRRPRTAEERRRVNEFAEGLALPGLDTVDRFRAALEQAGFTNIAWWDKTRAVLPSSRRFSRLGRLSFPLARIAERAGLVPPILTKHCRAGIRQYQLVRSGLAGYGVFLAEKQHPNERAYPVDRA